MNLQLALINPVNRIAVVAPRMRRALEHDFVESGLLRDLSDSHVNSRHFRTRSANSFVIGAAVINTHRSATVSSAMQSVAKSKTRCERKTGHVRNCPSTPQQSSLSARVTQIPPRRAPTAFCAPGIWEYRCLFLACSVGQLIVGVY
jgi:hypothetical protein